MDLNRRKILASLGLMGAGASIGGLGTQAYFSDTEKVTTVMTAGELDLKLDWKAYHNGAQIALQEPTDANGEIAASFEDVKPGDSGCFSLSLHNETNPAWVWLAMGIEDETDGGNGDGSQSGDCPITQYPLVCGKEETDGNITVSSDGTNLIVEFNAASGTTFEETHLHIGDSKDDVPSNTGGPIPGQFDYKHENVNSSTDQYVIPLSEPNAECGDRIWLFAHAAASDGETCWGGSTELAGANWALGISHTVCCEDSCALSFTLIQDTDGSGPRYEATFKDGNGSYEETDRQLNDSSYNITLPDGTQTRVSIDADAPSDAEPGAFVVTEYGPGWSSGDFEIDPFSVCKMEVSFYDGTVVEYDLDENETFEQVVDVPDDAGLSNQGDVDEIRFYSDSSVEGTDSESGSVLADNILCNVFWDDDEDCEIDADERVVFENITLRDLAANIDKSTGGLMPGWYSTGTQYLSITWWIDTQVGNQIQGDTLELSFCVYAEQRRHNDNPTSPWL